MSQSLLSPFAILISDNSSLFSVMSALFVGFSFYKQEPSATGIQNDIFAIFMITAILSSLMQQIMPRFVIQRSLYEVRERPSKAYSWIAFVMAQIAARPRNRWV